MQPLKRTYPVALSDKQIQEHIEWGLRHGYTREQTIEGIERTAKSETWRNDKYTVFVDGRGSGVVHLSIKRNDKHVARDWRHFQAIKNQLVGSENEGVELYPAESRLVDTANQYHLWVLEDATRRIPMGWSDPRLVSNDQSAGIRQRPLSSQVVKRDPSLDSAESKK